MVLNFLEDKTIPRSLRQDIRRSNYKHSEPAKSGRLWRFGFIKNSGYPFAKSYSSLAEVLVDRDLASLGDAYINFVYSLALSNRTGRPLGVKVKGSMLAQALRNAGLRRYLPSRMTKHALADAAEALIVYAWLSRVAPLEETVRIITEAQEPAEGLTQLLVAASRKTIFS
jgi:hypothetical protein